MNKAVVEAASRRLSPEKSGETPLPPRQIDSAALAKHGIVSIADNLPPATGIDPHRVARSFFMIFGDELEATLRRREIEKGKA